MNSLSWRWWTVHIVAPQIHDPSPAYWANQAQQGFGLCKSKAALVNHWDGRNAWDSDCQSTLRLTQWLLAQEKSLNHGPCQRRVISKGQGCERRRLSPPCPLSLKARLISKHSIVLSKLLLHCFQSKEFKRKVAKL